MSENTTETGQTTQAPELPKGKVTMTEKPLVLLFPTVTGRVDGKTVKAECSHQTWGHSSTRQAEACARKLAAGLGLTIG